MYAVIHHTQTLHLDLRFHCQLECLHLFQFIRDRWTRYGIRPGRVQKYHALDPWAWISGSKVRATRKVHGRVLIRLEEWFASYFRTGMGVSDSVSRLIAGIKRLGDYEIALGSTLRRSEDVGQRNNSGKSALFLKPR